MNRRSFLSTAGAAAAAMPLAARVTRGLGELCTWIGRDGALQGAQRPAGLGGWETHKQSTLGECTYAAGFFLRLLAMVATSKHLTD